MRCVFILVVLLSLLNCSEGFEKGGDRALTPLPSTIGFGAIAVGTTKQEILTIRHSGKSGDIELQSLEWIGGSSDIEIERPFPYTLSAGEALDLKLTYRPSDTNYDSGVIRIRHNAVGIPPLDVPVTTVLQSPQLIASPSPADFGNVSAQSEKEMTLHVVNSGTSRTVINNIGLDLKLGAPFSLIDHPEWPLTLEPGDGMDIKLRFSPPMTGTDALYSALLRFVTDHEATNNRVIPIQGTSRHAMLSISPEALAFGWVAVDSKVTQDVHLKNIGGDPLSIADIRLEQAHSSVTVLGKPPLPQALQPSETVTLTLKFSPTEPISLPNGLLGELVVESNDYVVSERRVPIYGNSANPSVGLVPSPVVDFGVVGVGFVHQRTVKVINYGDVPLSIQAFKLSDTTDKSFEIHDAPESPLSLSPGGGVAELILSYKNENVPSGETWGQLIVVSDDPVTPEAELALRARNTENAACVPRFEPPLLKFGSVVAGSKLSKSFHLLNDGSLPCIYEGAAFVDCAESSGLCVAKQGFSKAYSLAKSPPHAGTMVLYNDSLEIPVRFAPPGDSGDHGGLAVLTLRNGIDGSLFQYHSQLGGVIPSLLGSVGTAGIEIKPADLTFGMTTVGCQSSTKTVHLRQLGAVPLKLSSATSDDCADMVKLKNLPDLPHNLPEDWESALALDVRFVPSQAGIKSCTYLFSPDLPQAGSATLSLKGIGTLEKTRTEVFNQAPDSYVDILFVIDNSGSMAGEQQALVNGFEGFIQQAITWDVKYRIGVVTTDQEKDKGELQGSPKWVSNLNPDVFKKNALVGTKGSGQERGLVTAWMAFQPEMLVDDGTPCTNDTQCSDVNENSECVVYQCGGANRSFLRPNAKLVIVWLSDEDDQSAAPVMSYVDFYKSLKGEDKVTGYAIVGDPVSEANPTGGCGKQGSDKPGAGGGKWGTGKQAAKAGDRYVEAAESLGGFWSSICDFGQSDQNPILDKIGADAFKPVNSFQLKQAPDPATIKVEINSAQCTEGWLYLPETQSVVFDLASPCFPGPGAVVVIKYEPFCNPN